VKPRPLPKTVTPLADELLSGWLTRLAVTNHCEVDELLAHIEVDTGQVAMLDFEVEVAATTAEKNRLRPVLPLKLFNLLPLGQ
jgi:hypothetical protein